MNLSERLRAAAARSHCFAVAFLIALNVWICWRLFKVDFTNHFASIEGAFIGLARYLSRNWGDFSWFPIWHCGMPYQDTYVPMLHLTVAATAIIGKLPPAHAYHAVTAAMYALGPAALYLMAVRLGASRGSAFTSGLFYSLLSPCTWILPLMATDAGGYWSARRLQVLTAYGEGPHVSAMTLLPIAILALEHAVRERTRRAFGLAALALGLIFVTNVPGTMATGLAVFCWLVSQPARERRRAWILAGGAALFGYALACYGIPPSSEMTVFGNVGRMHQGFSSGLKNGPLLLGLALAATGALGWLLERARLPLVLRFAVLYSALTTLLVMTAKPQVFELLPQAGRLHLEMEIGMCLILGAATWYLYKLVPAWIHPIVLAILLGPVGIQARHYLERVHMETERTDLEKRSEYTSARWTDTHLPGQRIYVTGSTSFWWNAFTDNPQLIGCCDQGESMPILEKVPYLVNLPGASGREELSKIYLQALGVQAMVLPGPQSTDEYKDVHSPERYDAVLPVLHRESGDTIYAIPQRTTSLAHVILPSEAVPSHSDEPAIVRYAAAIEDPSRRSADLTWVRGGTARIRAELVKGDVVSVQVPAFNGWRATVNGRQVPITPDGLGFQLLHPDCEGHCEITLHWPGRPDVLPAGGVSLLALGFLGYLVIRRHPQGVKVARAGVSGLH